MAPHIRRRTKPTHRRLDMNEHVHAHSLVRAHLYGVAKLYLNLNLRMAIYLSKHVEAKS